MLQFKSNSLWTELNKEIKPQQKHQLNTVKLKSGTSPDSYIFW
jgi:hypothetical protein